MMNFYCKPVLGLQKTLNALRVLWKLWWAKLPFRHWFLLHVATLPHLLHIASNPLML